MFYNRACSGDGGAIYFISTNSYLRMIFANRCSSGASYEGHFANTITYQLQFFKSVHYNAGIPLPQRTPEKSLMNTPKEIKCFESFIESK